MQYKWLYVHETTYENYNVMPYDKSVKNCLCFGKLSCNYN